MTTPDPRAPRDHESWARPIDRLTTTASGAGSDTVTGRPARIAANSSTPLTS